MTPLASVIIPAHNEAMLIGRCLQAMLNTAEPNEFEVIVAANGCTDDTAAVAGKFDNVQVVQIASTSKIEALNAADSVAKIFPRIYVDADIVLETNALRATAKALQSGSALAAAPRIHVDVEKSSWLVRSYFRIYLQLPWTQSGMIGSGVYALSENGHRRLGRFPDVINDDLFVSRLFTPFERITVPDVRFTVAAPLNVLSLIRSKTRVAVGNIAQRNASPSNVSQGHARELTTYLRVARNPLQWPAFLTYSAIYAITRVGALFRLRQGKGNEWTRDETIRLASKS